MIASYTPRPTGSHEPSYSYDDPPLHESQAERPVGTKKLASTSRMVIGTEETEEGLKAGGVGYQSSVLLISVLN